MGTGYTRNDTANNIADGNIINASDLDGEFDAVQSAFDASTGHTHDGTAGEGAPIETIGPSQDVVATASVLRPKTDNTVDLGTTSLEYKDLFLDGTAHIDTLDVDENASITGTLGVTGTTTLGTANITTGTITTADINGGNIDGTIIGASSAAAITGTTITGTSFVTSGDMTFGDNDKAIFGTGSNLQIYHDGTHNYIEDTSTGNLYIQGTNLILKNQGGTENLADFVSNGAVTLYYDNSPKLATTSTGVDITGTLTSDGLTVDGADTEAANSQLLKVRNSTTGEAVTIGLYAKADNGGDGNSGSITFDAGADGNATNNEIRFNADHQTDTNPALSIYGNGDINFYASDGTTQAFHWDAADESLGIGTTTPSGKLQAYTSANRFQSLTGAAADLEIVSDNNTNPVALIKGTGTADLLNVFDNTEEVFTILDGGNVGIGTSSPSALLTVGNGLTGTKTIALNGGGSSSSVMNLDFLGGGTGNPSGRIGYASSTEAMTFHTGDLASIAERMRIDSSGNVGIGRTPSSFNSSYKGLQVGGTSGNSITLAGNDASIGTGYYLSGLGTYAYDNSSATVSMINMYNREFVFKTAASGTADTTISWSEAMRIDSSGRVGIGTSSPADSLEVAGDVASAHRIRINNANASGAETLSFTQGSTFKSWIEFDNSTSNFDVWQYTNNALRFGTNNTERMRIDASGNVGIGTSSPSARLEVHGSSGGIALEVQPNANDDVVFNIRNATANQVGYIQAHSDSISIDGDYTKFSTSGSEAMRLDSSGNLLVGTTGQLGSGSYSLHEIRGDNSSGGRAILGIYNSNAADAAPAVNAIKNSATTTSSQRFMQFYCNAGSTAMGGIVGNGASNVQFASISDAREKTNIQSITGSLDKINALNPVEFDWVASGEHVKAGFVAQEVEQVFPEFVVENMAMEAQEARKGITGGMSGGIIAHLVKAIQEQQATIKELEARITALENA